MRDLDATARRMDAQSLAGNTRRRPVLAYSKWDFRCPRDGEPQIIAYRWHDLVRRQHVYSGAIHWQVWNNHGPATVPFLTREEAVAWIDREEGGPVDAELLAKITECRASMEAARTVQPGSAA